MSIRPFGNESNCLPYILETDILGNGPFENRRFDADFVARYLVSYILISNISGSNHVGPRSNRYSSNSTCYREGRARR